MPLKDRIRIRAFLVGLALLGVLGIGIWFILPAGTSFPARPNPNGYEALVQAASRLSRAIDLDLDKTNELADFVAQNTEPLAELRLALALPSVVTVEMAETWLARHTSELMNSKNAALSLGAQARLCALNGDTNAALAIVLDALRFSDSIQRGGVYIDYLVGSACELIAIHALTNLLAGLDFKSCQQVLSQLEGIENRHEPFERLARREAEWSRKTFGVLKRIKMMIQTRSLRPGKELEFLVPDIAKEYRKRVTETRLALLLVASRAYELERGYTPQHVADLVPTYLQTQPTNLVTGKGFDFLDTQ